MAAPKKYGLILPKSKGNSSQRAAPTNVFGDDSDDEHDKGAIEEMIKKASIKNLSKVQTQMTLQKALNEDANVFEYDEVYDEMKSKKEAEDIATKKVSRDKKPRYIEHLLANAAARKKEDERRTQRKIQKEREEEKEHFGDKEAFVTASYKKKMEEMQLEEQKAKRVEQLEEMMDVTKQRDLSGFYRHLLKQQCGEERVGDGSSEQNLPSSSAEVSKEKAGTKNKEVNPDEDSDFLESSSSDDDDDDEKRKTKSEATTAVGKSASMGRIYRKRKISDDRDDEVNRSDKNSESDDKDESEDDSSSSDDSEAKTKKQKTEDSPAPKKEENTKLKEPPLKKKIFKDWREMFTKRCVGDKFEAAKERYFERKAARAGLSVQ